MAIRLSFHDVKALILLAQQKSGLEKFPKMAIAMLGQYSVARVKPDGYTDFLLPALSDLSLDMQFLPAR